MRGGDGKVGMYPALIGTYGHIYLCELVNGPKPTEAHEAEHMCGHNWCMNKRHLQWSTHSDNCKRRTQHGTQLIGERHNLAVLTVQQVKAIRRTPKVRGSGVVLADFYGVSTAAISLVRNKKNWKHLQ